MINNNNEVIKKINNSNSSNTSLVMKCENKEKLITTNVSVNVCSIIPDINLKQNQFLNQSPKRSINEIENDTSGEDTELEQDFCSEKDRKQIITNEEPKKRKKVIKQYIIVGTGLTEIMKQSLKKAATKLGAKIKNNVVEGVTHMVTHTSPDGIAPRTVKYLSAVMLGIWLLSFDWIEQSCEAGYWLDEKDFEVKGDSFQIGAPKKGRLGLKHLFKHWSFYFVGDFSLSANDLKLLSEYSGAKIIKQLSKSKNDKCVIFIDKKDNKSLINKIKNQYVNFDIVTHQWFLDSISSCKILSKQNYIIG
eukprot:TRINITY_DN2845_c1_g1_i2.p1 TRINITY_DN2845_c1_g1~~TRINITY_DN2845_c1_g1_i2.p1  ORF type:complete len:305 (-),score=100.94 TRINITY_DN2845_c1_g1_i2:89-1003(-)